MYPVFSPCKLNIRLKIFGKKNFLTPEVEFSSAENLPLNINVNNFVDQEKLKEVTAFTVIAKTVKGGIPTRVNHQLIYGEKEKNNALKCSINVSLTNKQVFLPKKKKGFAWGQIINHPDYNSNIGFCFKSSEGGKEKINIEFYNSEGKYKSINETLEPEKSLIINNSKIFGKNKKINFYWYVAKSTRPDLSAYSVHMHKNSGNSSGEHNF